MSSSSSSSTSSSPASVSSKVIPTKESELVTINEKVSLTKEQNEILQMICNFYEMTISEYMQQALVEAMKFDIEEGNFSDVLLEKLGEDNENSEKKKADLTQSSTLT
jgi:sulfur relay (sulfurtransferase) DsrC/TusE family protein